MEHRKVCAFFGHSHIPSRIQGEILGRMEQAIRKAITEQGVREFWCGGYGGFDAAAADTTHRLKQEFPDIRVIFVRAYLPRRNDFVPVCYDASMYPEGLESVPYRFAISRRNHWMAKNCDVCIAFVDHAFGGAYQAYTAAKRHAIVWNLADWSEA